MVDDDCEHDVFPAWTPSDGSETCTPVEGDVEEVITPAWCLCFSPSSIWFKVRISLNLTHFS